MGFGREDVVHPKKEGVGMGFKRDEANPHQRNQKKKKTDAGSTTKLLWNLLD